MDFEVWRVPSVLDTEPFDLVAQDSDSVSFSRQAKLTNHSQYEFEIQFDRKVVLLDQAAAEAAIGHSLEGLSWVSHESQNSLTNIGTEPWSRQTGLLGIWMLCMNKPSPKATAIIPFKNGDESELGPIVNADYFGKLDESRLIVDEDKNLIYFLGDGNLRSKLGLTFSRVQPILGSWDPRLQTLTVVQFNLPDKALNGYTNNLWEIQDDPFAGDVINSYNDGPNESGGMLGPFFELETLSPALALGPEENYVHVHRTTRIEGDTDAISRLTQALFGIPLSDIESKFGNQPGN